MDDQKKTKLLTFKKKKPFKQNYENMIEKCYVLPIKLVRVVAQRANEMMVINIYNFGIVTT